MFEVSRDFVEEKTKEFLAKGNTIKKIESREDNLYLRKANFTQNKSNSLISRTYREVTTKYDFSSDPISSYFKQESR